MRKKLENRAKYEDYFKRFFEKLNLEKTRHLSKNKSGSQAGYDIGWSFYNDNLGSELIKWHVEVKSTGLASRTKNPSVSKEIYEKIFQSLTISKQDFHCWLIVYPYITFDQNQKDKFNNLNDLYILPFKIIIWDQTFLERNIQRVSPDLHREFYTSNVVLSPDVSYLEKIINFDSKEGLFRHKLYNRYFQEKLQLKEDNLYNLTISNRNSNKGNFFSLEISSDSSYQSQNFMISRDVAYKHLNPAKLSEKTSSIDDVGLIQKEIIQKEDLLLFLKESLNSSGKSLYYEISKIVRISKDFCIISIVFEDDMFLRVPFDEIDYIDLELEENKDLVFVFPQQKEPLNLMTLKKINRIIDEERYLNDIDFIHEVINSNYLKWYFISKLPLEFSNLNQLNFLWKKLITDSRPFQLFKIFKSSIDKENSKYLIGFLKDNYERIGNGVEDTLFQKESIKIVNKIILKYPQFSDLVLDFVEHVLIYRNGDYKDPSSKRYLEKERDEISTLINSLYSNLSDVRNDDTERVINLIGEHFNLIGDDGKYIHYTPNSIFEVIKLYIDSDFHNNFNKIVRVLINQYKENKWYKDKWDGWEMMGSGMSRSGEKFVIMDRHFVTLSLAPSLEKFYKDDKDAAWKYIIDNCIKDQNDIDSDNPDFLNRSVIGVIFQEYSKTDSNQAYEFLKSLIQMNRGIPHKTELIFQLLANDVYKLTDAKKWRLVDAQLTYKPYKNLPANHFVEVITTDLAEKGTKEALLAIVSWSENKDYKKRISEFKTSSNSWKLLHNDKTFSDAYIALKNEIMSDNFINADSYRAWDISEPLSIALVKNTSDVIEFIQKIFDNEQLTKSQQILICDVACKIPDDDVKTQSIFFDDFIKPNFDEMTIDEIEKKIPFSQARESLVKFSDKLAKNKIFDKSLLIVKKFINDSDPNRDGSNNEDDPNGDFNGHKNIEKGKIVNSIITVRGWCAWTLQKFVVIGGDDYIDQVIELVDKLSKDENNYVRLQSCIPLMSLMKSRHSVLPGSRTRFMTMEQAERIENIAFFMLSDEKNHRLFEIMKSLGMVFSYMRTLSTDKILEVLNLYNSLYFEDISKSKENDLHGEVIKELVPLYIFYAEFRKNAYKNKKSKEIYSIEYWNDLNTFNSKPIKNVVSKLLKDSSDGVRSIFSWQLWKMTQDKSIKHKKLFSIAYRYLKIIAKIYSHGSYESIYLFIDENMELQHDKCLRLWKQCLRKERAYLKKHFSIENHHEMSWFPYMYNGKILMNIADKEGNDEFLKWLEFLLGYPKGLAIANDLNIAIDYLSSFTTNRDTVESIFMELIERNVSYYDIYEKWKSNL